MIETKSPPPDFRGNFHMAMFEYEFVVVQPLGKGRHTFYVVNRGTKPIKPVSSVSIRALSTEDVLTAIHQDSPTGLPGTLIGGMSGLEPGRDRTCYRRPDARTLRHHVPLLQHRQANRMPPKAWS